MLQEGYMKTTSLNVTGKLPQGLEELYRMINTHTKALNIPYLVVGATARDIILHHGFGANIERGTRDVDFGIQVQSWGQFEQLKANMLKGGFTPHKDKVHQLVTTVPNGEEWEIDIIPFGNICGENQTLVWPPEQAFEMTVMGFNEAFYNALVVTIADNPLLEIKIASPAGMLILKLVSWLERDHNIRVKDARDIYYLSKHYSKIPEIYDALYDDGFMESQDFDEHNASTMKLARDAVDIADKKTLSFINNQLFNQEDKVDNLVLEISRSTNISYEESYSFIKIIHNTLNV
tara:strand:- start:277 stop:1149 length:873 start_codon:yes stop_codon:yes gene_type:complete